MREQIKKITSLGWLGITALAFLISFYTISTFTYFFDVYTLEPWINAYKVSTSIAIDIFSEGTHAGKPYTAQRTSALAGIFFYLIMGPGLLILFGLGSRQKPPEGKKYNSRFTGFVIGLSITMAGLLTFGAQAILETVVYDSSRMSAAQSAKADEIRHNLAALATESYEYMVLPKDLDGGDGSFEGLHIEDLPSYAELEAENYTFGETSSDTLLRIIGTGKPDYPLDDPNRKEIKLTVQVLPSDIMKWEKKE